MLTELTKLLEAHKVPTKLMVEIKGKLADGFQPTDVTEVVKLIQENQTQISESAKLITQIKEIGSASGAIDSLKNGNFSDALNKAKGILG